MILVEWRHKLEIYWLVGEWISWDLGASLDVKAAGVDEEGALKAAKKAGLEITHKEVWAELPDGDMGLVCSPSAG